MCVCFTHFVFASRHHNFVSVIHPFCVCLRAALSSPSGARPRGSPTFGSGKRPPLSSTPPTRLTIAPRVRFAFCESTFMAYFPIHFLCRRNRLNVLVEYQHDMHGLHAQCGPKPTCFMYDCASFSLSLSQSPHRRAPHSDSSSSLRVCANSCSRVCPAPRAWRWCLRRSKSCLRRCGRSHGCMHACSH